MFVYNVSVMSITMEQLKVSAEFLNQILNLIFSATTELGDYASFADSVIFLRRRGVIGSNVYLKNASEIQKLIVRYTDFFRIQIVARKSCTVVKHKI